MDIDSDHFEPPLLSDLYSEVQSPSGDMVGDFSVHDSESEVQADTHQTPLSTSPASHALPLIEEKAELDDNVQNAQTLHQSQSAEDSALAESSVPATQTVATTDLTAWHAFNNAIAQPFLDVDLYNPPNSVETYIPHYTNSFNFDYPSFNFGPVDWSSDERVSDLPRLSPPHGQFLPLPPSSPSLPTTVPSDNPVAATEYQYQPKRNERDVPDTSKMIDGSMKHSRKPTSKVVEAELTVSSTRKPLSIRRKPSSKQV
ncbi:hypothetical protein E1B28_010721 [Marasmius oreades]|uniref:Uncharacterized protein n=1 Tax=Marasmius oreades TaxID=181124 RepID=A0A9P7RTZ7_9AGAR|nr:uncharacterized protein E1B28_010721 [Marasmius oreades]KAG7089008.1 hypothetical protein E1B28_010721 [Marasmius oreades]